MRLFRSAQSQADDAVTPPGRRLRVPRQLTGDQLGLVLRPRVDCDVYRHLPTSPLGSVIPLDNLVPARRAATYTRLGPAGAKGRDVRKATAKPRRPLRAARRTRRR